VVSLKTKVLDSGWIKKCPENGKLYPGYSSSMVLPYRLSIHVVVGWASFLNAYAIYTPYV